LHIQGETTAGAPTVSADKMIETLNIKCQQSEKNTTPKLHA